MVSNRTCVDTCPKGLYLYNETKNNASNPRVLCYEMCPVFMWTQDEECVLQCDSAYKENKFRRICVPVRENNNWLYILIGSFGGVIAIVSIVCVFVYCIRSGFFNKKKY